MSKESLIITPIPSLIATLLNKEREKGSPLTIDEVENIRDNIDCKALSSSQRSAVDERRGYDDIDPEKVWEEWQEVRKDFFEDK